MTGVGRRDLRYCPRCGKAMFLGQIKAKFGPLPETRQYRCSDCQCVVEEEIDRDQPFKFAGLANWPSARLVN
jgi:DNA-directed RNA polymerase subunit RPC12/RpoP